MIYEEIPPQCAGMCELAMKYASKNIENVEFAAVGFSNQVEFYTSDGKEYFTLYNSEPGAPRQITLQLEKWHVKELRQGFEVSKGARAHRFQFGLKNDETTLKVTSHLWRWLVYSSVRGKLTPKGKAVIESNFGKYI